MTTQRTTGNGIIKITITAFTLSVCTTIAVVGLAWGKITTTQEMLCREIEKKANQETFEMYMSQTEKYMESIDKKLNEMHDEIKSFKERND